MTAQCAQTQAVTHFREQSVSRMSRMVQFVSQGSRYTLRWVTRTTCMKAHMKNPYGSDGRLQDVLSLIQVLAYSPKTRRTDQGLQAELKRAPANSKSWIELAKQHPEFFRVREDHEKSSHVSLIARNAQQSVVDDDGDPLKPLLTTDVANKLMELAVGMHDREVRRKEFWRSFFIPIVVAVIAATAAVTSAVITALYRAGP